MSLDVARAILFNTTDDETVNLYKQNLHVNGEKLESLQHAANNNKEMISIFLIDKNKYLKGDNSSVTPESIEDAYSKITEIMEKQNIAIDKDKSNDNHIEYKDGTIIDFIKGKVLSIVKNLGDGLIMNAKLQDDSYNGADVVHLNIDDYIPNENDKLTLQELREKYPDLSKFNLNAPPSHQRTTQYLEHSTEYNVKESFELSQENLTTVRIGDTVYIDSHDKTG